MFRTLPPYFILFQWTIHRFRWGFSLKSSQWFHQRRNCCLRGCGWTERHPLASRLLAWLFWGIKFWYFWGFGGWDFEVLCCSVHLKDSWIFLGSLTDTFFSPEGRRLCFFFRWHDLVNRAFQPHLGDLNISQRSLFPLLKAFCGLLSSRIWKATRLATVSSSSWKVRHCLGPKLGLPPRPEKKNAGAIIRFGPRAGRWGKQTKLTTTSRSFSPRVKSCKIHGFLESFPPMRWEKFCLWVPNELNHHENHAGCISIYLQCIYI